MPSDYAVPQRYRARLRAFVNRQPPRMQPVYRGAGLLADLFLLRIGGAVGAALVAIFLGLKSGLVGVLQFGAVFVLAVLGGAAGGAVYSVLTPALKLGHLGRWLRWVLATGTYVAMVMIGLILLAAITMESAPTAAWQDGSDVSAFLGAMGITTVLVGSMAAWFTREPKRNRPTPLTARQIVRKAVGQDVRALSSVGTDQARAALVAIHARVPSTEYVAHLERVRERIEGMTGNVDRAARTQAVAIVQRGQQTARRRPRGRSRHTCEA